MKKVIGAVVAGTLVAGMASADVAITLKNRLRPSLYNMTQTYATKGSKTSKLFDFGESNHNDNMIIAATGENCGARVDINLRNGQSTYGDTACAEAQTSTFTNSNGVAIDNRYDAWMSFGALKVSFGRFDSRHVNHYSETIVEGGLADDFVAKYGVSKYLNGGIAALTATTAPSDTFLFDFSNATATGGTKVPCLVVDYTIPTDSAKIMIKGGLLASSYKDQNENVAKDDDKSYQGAGYMGEVDVDASFGKLQFLLKMPTEHKIGFGAYADIKAVENLGLAFGFTWGQSSEYDTYSATTHAKTGTSAKFSAFAVDARAFYKVSDPMKVGLQVKYSSYKKDNDTANDDKANTGLELVGTFQYVVSDLLNAQLDAGLYYEDLDDGDKKNVAENFVMLRPAVKISASKNAAITAALQCAFAINGGDAEDNKPNAVKSYFSIPVVCRVAL